MAVAPFDNEYTLRFTERRLEFLEPLLAELTGQNSLKTAIDVGCGFGDFSYLLSHLGFQVVAIDGRTENVEEARRRNPGLQFVTRDVEDPALASMGTYDLVFCFGLLYHLENPFRAVRNLAALTGRILLIGTRVAPFRTPSALYFEEDKGQQDQGLNYVSMIPSEAAFLKMLYAAGFTHVYRTRDLPDHEQFRSSLIRKRMRVIFVAAREELRSPKLKQVPNPWKTNRFRWYRLGLGHILEYIRPIYKRLRNG